MTDPLHPSAAPRERQHFDQAGLVLLASLPCLFIAILAMWFNGISIYFIAFATILLSLPIIYAAFTGRQGANYQLQTLSNLLEAMIEGDYSLRGRSQSNPAFQELLLLINKLADNLQQHKMKAQESELLLNKIMDQMDAMVVAVAPQGTLAMCNASARQLLLNEQVLNEQADSHGQEVTEQRIKTLSLADLGLSELAQRQQSGVIELDTDTVKGEYFLFKDRFISDNQPHDLYLLTRADRLLREKERQAWQNLLRVLSHELNNSLTPIATFSRSMLKRLRSDRQSVSPQSFYEGLSIIKERAESLSDFVASYSQLSNLPAPHKQPLDWREKLTQLSALVLDCRINNRLMDNPALAVTVYADPQQLEQVFINLLKNASEAMEGMPRKIIELDARIEPQWLHISIGDHGSGIANSDNLFVPFYTTKETGSGIGLTLCRQIIMNHNGRFTLKNRQNDQGAEATLSLPLVSQAR